MRTESASQRRRKGAEVPPFFPPRTPMRRFSLAAIFHFLIAFFSHAAFDGRPMLQAMPRRHGLFTCFGATRPGAPTFRRKTPAAS